PSEEVGLRLSQKGVDDKKIRPFGIPHDPKFAQLVVREEVFKKLNLNPVIPTILVMGGGQGLGPIKTIVGSLEKVNGEIQEIVITGNNAKLYNSLSRTIKKFRKKIVLFGYANNIHELMEISRLVITKPGGITTAEALAKNLPMLIIEPIPGQEANNTLYLTQNGAAIHVDNMKKINIIVEDLLAHPQKIDALRQSVGLIRKPNASMDIAKLLLSSSNG
ncbi:MAG: galactosyldiacylglycerol synthase, partial [Candidatus Omnitrophica bacterium]|nr:galactosyldiacylglycerol synthase [Candidatus Omnitrophota bacterium]